MARPNYRRRNDKDSWHFCTNCTNWPTIDYETSNTKPTSGEFCNQCLSKERNGECN
ncbi:MAG: hypothetical protein M3N53_12875 [Actinomycetota bacterium]|nr:hypothetical protein [Actinomycetota bacterium]